MALFDHTAPVTIDSADPIIAGQVYPARDPFTVDVPVTGVFIDSKGSRAVNSTTVLAMYPAGGTAPADPANITPAEFLLLEIIEAGASSQSYDDTSVQEYKVAWGGVEGGSNAGSSSVYVADDDVITLEHDGDYTFDVLPYQNCLSQEAGTMTGGVFYLKNSAGGTLASLTFPNVKIDQVYANRPYSGSRQTLYRPNMTAGTYRLGFTSAAGAGSGNRVSYEGYAHVIVRRSSLLPSA